MQLPITECPACCQYVTVDNPSFMVLLEKGKGCLRTHTMPVGDGTEQCPASKSRVTLTSDELSDFRADHDDERRHDAAFEASCQEDCPDIGPAPWAGEF